MKWNGTIRMSLLFLSALPLLLQADESSFNGLYMSMGNLPRISDAETRSISPENFTGEKGKGGMVTLKQGLAAHAARDLGQGWKVSPYIHIKSKQTYTLAKIEGPGAIQQIWMTPTGHWRYSILRFYWDGETQPSVEVPVGDFFGTGWGRYLPLKDDIASVTFWYQTESHAPFPKLPGKDDLEVN